MPLTDEGPAPPVGEARPGATAGLMGRRHQARSAPDPGPDVPAETICERLGISSATLYR